MSNLNEQITELSPIHLPELNGKVAMIVAHPDDEVLWGGGLLSRYSGFDVICCSIPRRDPERALNFFYAVRFLGHNPILLPYTESNPDLDLEHLELLNLEPYDLVITHNSSGEYGHLHHMNVHHFVSRNFKKKIIFFGYKSGNLKLSLSQNEQEQKIQALKHYDSVSPLDSGKPKYAALLEKYKLNMELETYIENVSMPDEQAALLFSLSNSGLDADTIRSKADYQKFEIRGGKITALGARMSSKLNAITRFLPDSFEGKNVLDIGCDFGFWSFLAASAGAKVVALDRSRDVKDIGWVNIPMLNNITAEQNKLDAFFYDFLAGVNWYNIGKYDLIFCMSVYHHIYELAGRHEPIWHWLWMLSSGTLIWENPTDISDRVVQMNVSNCNKQSYDRESIMSAASKYFTIKDTGPALHETTREVWLMEPIKERSIAHHGITVNGAGGASKAFRYMDSRRVKELQKVVGIDCVPGSLNIMLDEGERFNWDIGYFTASVLDLKDRSLGLHSEWEERTARLYPVKINSIRGWVFRFEGEKYPDNFVEVVSDTLFRAKLKSPVVTVERVLPDLVS